MENIDRVIGERLRRRRTEKGLTQEQLAAALGVSYQQIQKYESGSNRISAARLHALAERMDVPVAFFFSERSCETSNGGRETSLASGPRQRNAVELLRSFNDIGSNDIRLAMIGLARAVAERQVAAD